MRIIALANQKGGVAKTTTTFCLGTGLAEAGKRVLLIDADPQGNLTQLAGWQQPDSLPFTLSTVMERIMLDGELSAQEGILRGKEGFDLLPANLELASTEVSLVNAMSRETILRQYIEPLRPCYDYILIDCMPSLGMMTINALTVADGVIVPVQAHYLPVGGLERLMQSIARVRRQLNPHLALDGILLTMVDSRTRFSREIAALLRETYPGKVFRTEIPQSIRAAEMSLSGQSIYQYDPTGKVAKAYRELTQEVIALEKQPQRKRHRADQAR